MRREGFTALVHTAAASNVGQMLNRVCQQDGIGLVNIVRNDRQVQSLRSIGAEYVCNSSSATFDQDLQDALRATDARLAFDATGGGTLASQILAAMEKVDIEGKPVRQYGSSRKKKVYMYGKLDPNPLQILGNYGLSWSIGGWLVYNFLQEVGPGVLDRLKTRISNEIETTFATKYSKVVHLDDVIDPDVLSSVSQFSTGGKYLAEVRPK
jgi:NADPH:quinone reductase